MRNTSNITDPCKILSYKLSIHVTKFLSKNFGITSLIHIKSSFTWHSYMLPSSISLETNDPHRLHQLSNDYTTLSLLIVLKIHPLHKKAPKLCVTLAIKTLYSQLSTSTCFHHWNSVSLDHSKQPQISRITHPNKLQLSSHWSKTCDGLRRVTCRINICLFQVFNIFHELHISYLALKKVLGFSSITYYYVFLWFNIPFFFQISIEVQLPQWVLNP